jgi:outer membrane receptor protein involved in Fe transport
VYLRYARAIRPGGLNAAESAGNRHFVADELSNVDLGARLQLAGNAVSLQGVLFATRWSHIQSDYLLANGLAATRNVGNGRNFGIEGNAGWLIGESWRFEAAATVQHARLHHSTLAEPEDPRLPVVPDVRLRGSMVRSFALADWQATLRADAYYVGATRLSFEEALDRKTPAYATFDARFSLQRGGVDLTLDYARCGIRLVTPTGIISRQPDKAFAVGQPGRNAVAVTAIAARRSWKATSGSQAGVTDVASDRGMDGGRDAFVDTVTAVITIAAPISCQRVGGEPIAVEISMEATGTRLMNTDAEPAPILRTPAFHR